MNIHKSTLYKSNLFEVLHVILQKCKACLSPAVTAAIRDNQYKWAERLRRLRFWQWENVRFPLSSTPPMFVHYIGRKEMKPMLMALLGADKTASELPAFQHASQLRVTEFPTPDAICMPACLITIVKLNRTVDEVLATYSRSLRRSINAQRADYRYEVVENSQQMAQLENEMFRPYATARHDMGAAQLDMDVIKKLAKPEYGRLDVLYQGDEAVGVHLGNHYVRDGKRYWHVNRFGYPAHIYSDYKRWGDVNAMNLHLALESAIANNYDYCDYGISLAKPGAGLIEWKRRRKGFLSSHGIYQYFYLNLPKVGAAEFLWNSPVFGVENAAVTLHLGLPADKTEEEIKARYHEMGYGGLHKVYLHTNQAPSAALIASIQSLYADQASQPEVITSLVN